MIKRFILFFVFIMSQYISLAQSCTPVATITPAGTVSICDGSNITLTAPASNAWVQKTDFGGVRYGTVAFSIGSKGYIGTGRDATRKNDFWEYDPATNSWTQKANFGGTARYYAIGFSIGSKGYIGTGRDVSGKRNDFWEYDQATNTWTQKTNFGGVARDNAVGFSIGSKGYIGTGFNGTVDKNDFWEYDPSTNGWTQKANFGGTAREAAKGFSIGTKGYIGTGYDGAANIDKKDFWEYNPAADSWTQKVDFGGTAREGAAAFSIGSKGYLGTGYEYSSNTDKSDFWEYDQATDSWIAKANFGGGVRELSVGFSIGSKGYIGTGWTGTYKKDFWEYDPGYTYTWSSGQTTQTVNVNSSGNYTVTLTNILGCSNTSAPTVVAVSNTWPGGGTSDWNTPGNWSCGTVPNNSGIDAVILNSASPMPVLNSDINIANLTLNGTATVILNNNKLSIGGAVSGTGSISGSAASSLTLNGTTGNLTFTSGAETLKDLLLNTGASAALTNTLNITAGATPGSVTLNTGAILNTGGNLVLKSDASGTARISSSSGSINGDVTVERFIPARRSWRLLTAPFTPTASTTISQAWQDGQQATTIPPPAYTVQSGTLITSSTTAINGYDKGSSNKPSLKYYTGSAWGAPAATTIPVNTYPGYMLFVRGDRNFIIGGPDVAPAITILRPKGSVNIGTQTINNSVGTGFQVVGNPFASAINFHTITRSGLGDIYYLWDPAVGGLNSAGGFVTFAWNNTNGNYDQTVTGSGTTTLPNDGTIESGAAFLVNFSGAGNLQIKESDKINTSSSAPFGRPVKPENTGSSIRASLGFTDTNNSTALLDGVLITYNNEYTNEINEQDAVKLKGFTENIAVSKNKQLLAIERRQPVTEDETVFFNLSQLKIRTYTLELAATNIEQPGLCALLEDNFTGKIIPVNLAGKTKYSFNVINESGSYAADRLHLVYRKISGAAADFDFTIISVDNNDGNNTVKWQVNKGDVPGEYFVEHSNDGIHFSAITLIPAYNTRQSDWLYVHSGVTDALHFYRIGFKPYTGEIKYSAIVKSGTKAGTNASISVNPNPVEGGQLNLSLNNFEKGSCSIKLTDQKGTLIYKSVWPVDKGNSIKMILLAYTPPAGLYTVEVTDDKGNSFQKQILFR